MNLARLPGFFYLFLVSIALIAQPPRDPAPLKYWPAPLYWQPTQASTTCTIPSNALAYSFNLTVVTSSFLNYLTVWPYGSTQPNASTLNDDLGTVVANAAIIPAGNDSSGSINVFASNNTDLIIDINGYYTTQIVMPAGSASAPSLAFSGNAGTGMYSPITGVVDIVSGGQTSLSVGGVNTAVGYQDLVSNTMGTENTAVGSETLVSNTTGSENTSTGYFSLYSNTTGSYNTANGFFALGSNNGSNNTAYGAETMHANGNGGSNTAIGYQALYSNSSGGQNTVLGFQAGYNIIGDNNIAIGNQGTNTDSGVIRLGTSGMQNSAYIAGIYSVAASGGVPVYINSNGQLGTTTSSRRYKDDIQDMGDASSGLLQLRPVTFRYKQPYADGSKPIDYGLIAEEVAAVYPDLVVKNAEGQIETVQYQKLTPMLLNELQKQGQLIRDLQSRLAALEAQSAGSAR